MIEIDNNQHSDDEPFMNGDDSFLSDEARSGFSDDDAESFGLGSLSPAGEAPPEPATDEAASQTPLSNAPEPAPVVGEFSTTEPETEQKEDVIHTDTATPTEDAHEDFEAPTETKARTVISIPDADSQRKADAERAANDNARRAEALKRKKQSRTSILTAVALGVLLGALVGLGYVFARQTALGDAVRTLWATLNGSSGAQTERQSFVASSGSDENALDLTREAKTNPNQAQQSQTEQNQAQQNQAEQNQTEQNEVGQTSSNGNVQGVSVAAASSAVAEDSLAPEKRQAEPTTEQRGKEARSSSKESPSPEPPTKPTKEQSAENSSPKPNKTPAQVKQAKIPPASVMERNTKRLETGVFAIQVYATPSVADAEDWVERLRRRGMANPVMSSQVVRGQMMYRVRFGLYNSLQEAERDAARFGYRDSWVVRLR